MQPKQEVPNLIPLVEYHVESYQDLDSNNTKLRIVEHDGHSYDLRKGERLERYGTTFNLSIDGQLNIMHTTCEYQPKIKVSGLDIVNLQGQNFKKLDIKANKVNFVKDCAVADLKVVADQVANRGLLNTRNVNLKADQIRNYKIIQAANNIKLKSTHGMASGWSTALLSGAASGPMHAALAAGLQSIMAQAASVFVANNGDLKKALKDLCKKDTLKKLATSMLSAGVMDKVTTGLILPTEVVNRSMPQNIAHNVTKATLDAGLSSGISGKDFDKALQENLINTAFTTLGNKIDLLDVSKDNNTLLHAMLGGVRGMANKEGWLVGMVDSVVSARLPGYVKKLQKKKLAREKVKASKFKNNKELLKLEQERRWLEQEQLLWQKEELKQKIYNKLSVFVRIQDQASNDVDFGTMLAAINNIVDASDVIQLQDLGEKFDNLFNMNVGQPIITATSLGQTKDSSHSSSSSESISTWWEEFKKHYVKVTTEYDTVEIVVNEQQSKAILNAYRSLSSKFSTTDWKPLQSANSILKTHTVGIGKDKNGRIHNRDIGSGKFSKSALEKAKNSWRRGEPKAPTIDSSVGQTLADKSQCWKADLGRTTEQDNLEIQTGPRAYVCDATGGTFNITKESTNIEGSVGGSLGTNLASGRAKNSLGEFELQVSGPSASFQAEGHLVTDKKVASIDLKSTMKLTAGGVHSQFLSEKLCNTNKCCSVQLDAALELGVGGSIGGSYKHDSSKKSDNIAFTIGLGPGVLPTLGLKVNCEPKERSQETLTTQQNNATSPKPSL